MPTTTVTTRPLLTIAEVAGILRVSARTVRRLVDDGQLRSVRPRRALRFRPEDIEAFVAGDS